MQTSYGTPYPSYMYAQPLPSTASMYGHPPPMTPAMGRGQGFRHDAPMLAPPPGGAYMAMPSPNGHGPPPPHEQEQRVTGGERTLRSTHRFTNHDASDPTKKPLKSAMKKSARTEHGELHRSRTMPTREGDGYYNRPPELKPTASGMSRGRSMSEGKTQRPRASSLSRPRSRSQSRRNFTPGMCLYRTHIIPRRLYLHHRRPFDTVYQWIKQVCLIDAWLRKTSNYCKKAELVERNISRYCGHYP